ncbi:MAG TPA: flavodoxin family protein [Candidatus Paceibacterota bacterium]|nr:flavodoxin family protein [Verrucomicrobiota bacterium]HRZ47641.1 flavodoxin family protein [Candidatus Paceibacterota bacterium]HRZ58405.1 flavodoxin family protein [Candidatus Paceibacterota bacterium]
MKENVTRRSFLATAGVAALGAGVAKAAEGMGKPVKIIGVACSPRKGMTTAKAVQAALDAAKVVDPRITVELIDLGGLSIAGYSPQPPQDDFAAILPKLQNPAVGGLILGSPAYFRGMSALCKAFIERCAPLREPKMVLANKPVGVVAVGAFRNGGQEMTIEQIQAAMLCFGMIAVGGNAPAFQGATVLSTKDDISADTLGLDTAKKLGAHLAEMALKLTA